MKSKQEILKCEKNGRLAITDSDRTYFVVRRNVERNLSVNYAFSKHGRSDVHITSLFVPIDSQVYNR